MIGTNELTVDERGSLVLTHDSELDQYCVHFADWYETEATSSLAVARDWFELTDPGGRAIRLNGSQAAIVVAWAKEYL